MENMILQPIVVGGQTFKNRIMFPDRQGLRRHGGAVLQDGLQL